MKKKLTKDQELIIKRIRMYIINNKMYVTPERMKKYPEHDYLDAEKFQRYINKMKKFWPYTKDLRYL